MRLTHSGAKPQSECKQKVSFGSLVKQCLVSDERDWEFSGNFNFCAHWSTNILDDQAIRDYAWIRKAYHILMSSLCLPDSWVGEPSYLELPFRQKFTVRISN